MREEHWKRASAIGFTERFPQNEDDLAHCAAFLTSSSHFDESLSQDTIIRLMKALCTEGTGQLLITKCGPLTPFLGEHPFVSVSFSAYITQEYAKDLVAMTDVRFICMDFLRRYRDFIDYKKGYNPAHTRASIENDYNKHDFRMYFLSLFSIFHPIIPPISLIPLPVKQRFSKGRQECTLRIFGGFRYSGWFNCLCGEAFIEGYTKLGHKVLRPDRDNNADHPNKRHYLLCLTSDAQTSNEIGLQDYYDTVGWFNTNLFNTPAPVAKLSKGLERRAAYLMALEYEPTHIMRFLYPDEVSHDMEEVPKAIQDRYRALKFSICDKFKDCGHISPEAECNATALHDAIRRNMHEVRPLIIALYPDPGAGSYSKRKPKRR